MIENDIPYFEIKGSGDFIRVELAHLSHPNAGHEWDKNWVKSNVTVKAGGFSGKFTCDLMTTDFARFQEQVSRLYNELDGAAVFDTIEEQVNIKIKGDGFGHFEADCVVMDFAGTGNTLEFLINFDQTIIPQVVRQLANIAKDFPVTGT
ncbi:WapI family immunity protein [Rufibacter immobilis]|nr:hypothetical protein [Rufibacter immobilis]